MEQNEKYMPPPDPKPSRHRDPLRKDLILVAEDDPDISKMLRIYLDSLGYEVLLAKQGNEVLEICIQDIPDAVILNPIPSSKWGSDVYQELRSNSKTKYIPIVFIPEKRSMDQTLEGIELGERDEFITKPFDIEDIKKHLERMVPKRPCASSTVLWQSDEK